MREFAAAAQALFVSLLLVACSQAPQSAADPAASGSDPTAAASQNSQIKVAAILSYADWCASCKILDPKLDAVKASGPIDGLDYIVLDYTALDDSAYFDAADAAGVGPAMRARFSEKVKTGLLLVVDMSSGEIINEITKTMSETEIRTALVDAAAL